MKTIAGFSVLIFMAEDQSFIRIWRVLLKPGKEVSFR